MKSAFKKVLIANRGEIAVRIMKTCREMNISTVAIYSEIDISMPFVRMADESYCLGPAPAKESYLNQEKILHIAKTANVDAIHPGYGFLSENAEFASKVEKMGVKFIGPSSDAIRLMGDKTSARRLAQSVGVPMVPGTIEPIQSLEELEVIANKIGYPVLIKASAGGGGKGMRVIHSVKELASAFRASQSEALSAFGDSRVYVEKYIEKPRHIEVQILADTFGNVLHLGERECSIQRRHQKIVEESPSVSLNDALRMSITSSAVNLVKEGKYTNAGTVEFLLDSYGNYYFMEVNTRLQVEHPVTELRTGLDLVREQIRIAEGTPLSLRQEDIQFSGHAIECRIYAEDSFNNFFPSSGKIVALRSPGGTSIREDRGFEEGNEVSSYYDPLLSKLIGYGKDRDEAINRLTHALSEYELFGVKNNIDLCLWILTHSKYRNNEIDTNFIANNFSTVDLARIPDAILKAAIITACTFETDQQITLPVLPMNASGSQWKNGRIDNLR